MRRYERIQQIKELLVRERLAYNADLAARFDVSPSMIWRDLQILKQEGFILNVRGKAILATPLTNTSDTPSTTTVISPSAVKSLAQLVRENHAVILDWGPVSLQFAQYVPKDMRAVVVTNSPVIAMTFSDHHKIDVWVIGGKLRGQVLIPTKKEEIQILQRIHAELCVLGMCNIDHDTVSTPDSAQEAELKSEMMSFASKVAVTVNNESLGSTSGYLIGPLKKITHILPARDVTNKKLKPLENKGIIIVRE